MAGHPASIPTLGHFIGGERVIGGSSRVGDVRHPATGRARAPFAAASEVDKAGGAA